MVSLLATFFRLALEMYPVTRVSLVETMSNPPSSCLAANPISHVSLTIDIWSSNDLE
jgi:hypothetical protein